MIQAALTTSARARPSIKAQIGESVPRAERGPAPKLQQLERITRLPKPQQRVVMQIIDRAKTTSWPRKGEPLNCGTQITQRRPLPEKQETSTPRPRINEKAPPVRAGLSFVLDRCSSALRGFAGQSSYQIFRIFIIACRCLAQPKHGAPLLLRASFL